MLRGMYTESGKHRPMGNGSPLGVQENTSMIHNHILHWHLNLQLHSYQCASDIHGFPCATNLSLAASVGFLPNNFHNHAGGSIFRKPRQQGQASLPDGLGDRKVINSGAQPRQSKNYGSFLGQQRHPGQQYSWKPCSARNLCRALTN